MEPRPIRLLRWREASERTGIRSQNTARDYVARGLLTRPVRISDGPTTPLAWPDHEIDAIIAARIRGGSDDDIRALVSKLEAERRAVA